MKCLKEDKNSQANKSGSHFVHTVRREISGRPHFGNWDTATLAPPIPKTLACRPSSAMLAAASTSGKSRPRNYSKPVIYFLPQLDSAEMTLIQTRPFPSGFPNSDSPIIHKTFVPPLNWTNLYRLELRIMGQSDSRIGKHTVGRTQELSVVWSDQSTSSTACCQLPHIEEPQGIMQYGWDLPYFDFFFVYVRFHSSFCYSNEFYQRNQIHGKEGKASPEVFSLHKYYLVAAMRWANPKPQPYHSHLI